MILDIFGVTRPIFTTASLKLSGPEDVFVVLRDDTVFYFILFFHYYGTVKYPPSPATPHTKGEARLTHQQLPERIWVTSSFDDGFLISSCNCWIAGGFMKNHIAYYSALRWYMRLGFCLKIKLTTPCDDGTRKLILFGLIPITDPLCFGPDDNSPLGMN